MRTAQLLNLFFPPQCLQCNSRVPTHGTLCRGCWDAIHFISAPCCARCGFPFEYSTGGDAMCGVCLHDAPRFTMGRSVFRYDDASRNLILRLKFQDDTSVSTTYGAWLAQAAAPFLEACDAIIPVPLHYRRLIERRYNQAAMLAYGLARHANLPVWPDSLRRIRATSPQSGLDKKERAKNVKRAFDVHSKHAERMRGKRLLLLDDVMTTGATLNACADALFKANARDVYVLTLARRI